MAKTVADQFAEVLATAGVKRIYGIVGDSLNGLTDALRRQGKIEWIHVRHEEVAAFAAGAEAHLTGELAVCAGSCGPGNLHLINGLFDCRRSRVPVLAIAAQIPSAEIGAGYFQETHPETLFRECSHYCELITGANQMPSMGLFLAAVLVPIQIFFGHLTGDYVHDRQPAKFAAIEARWHDEQPAGEVLIAIPDPVAETNRYEIKIPILGSLIASMSFTSKEIGLTDFPPQNRPPVLIPFFTFRIMVSCGLIMLALAWLGSYLSIKGRIAQSRFFLWLVFLSFPLPFIAVLTGWYTAEVGRQPWVVYGVLRTADAMTPFLTSREAGISLVVFCGIYTFIFAFGIFYIHLLLRAGPAGHLIEPPSAAVPNRPMSVAHHALSSGTSYVDDGESP